MRLSQQTVQRAFDEIAQLGIDNKFWGVLTIVKNVKKYLKLPTSIGTMSLIVCDKNGVQNDLKNFFSLQNTTDNNKQANDDDWLLLRKDFASWVSYELLANKRVNFLSLAVFLFRNTSFQERLTSDLLIQKVKSFLNIPKEWEKDWFKEIASFDIEYEDSFNQSWSCDFSVGLRKYKFDKTHGSIVFKPSKDIYSVVAKPDELSRGPFYQPLYAAQGNAILFIKKDFFENVEEIKKTNEDVGEVKKQNNTNSITPSQIIYYGVPGCGKSYEVNKVINDELDKYSVADKEYHKVRCVFHPEYCNADFVGQIYPYVKPDNGGVEYRFKPGPFAEIVRRAYRNPAEPFFLVIEEINRGNAAAIFGEMFQLLDRIRPEDGPEELSGNVYDTGWSSYGVTNIDVNAYIRQKSTDNPEKIEYDDSVPYGNEIKFINNTAVRLPPNLSIYATMNTNDQNVFTMDNAFQRRFKSKMIRNVLDENSAQYKTEIDDTGVYWGDFRKWINEKILLPQTAVLKADDKCLGGWFITGEKINGVDKIKKEDFAEKVLKYLWDDVFKRNKSGEIFVKDDKVNSLSDLIDAFETSVGFESFEKIFKMNDVDKAKLQKQVNT